MLRMALFVLVGGMALSAASETFAQVPGQIPDPSSYQGSMELQRREAEQAARTEAQNQAMQQRLDDSYKAYAPGRGGAGPGAGRQGASLKSKPLLPAARNPLLGRWQQTGGKPLDLGLMGQFPGVADIVNGSLAGGCKSIFGEAGVVFTPTALNWLAEDGHEEILNHVEYRSDGANIIVIPTDSDLPLIFGLADHDHAVVALFGCQMRRLAAGQKPVQMASLGRGPAGSLSGKAILNLTVGQTINGTFSAPPAGTRIFLTSQNPDANLVRAGFAGNPPIEALFAACKIGQGGTQARCSQGFAALISGAVGEVYTDGDGRAATGAVAPGRYYLVGFTPYQGHSLIWHLPVDLRPGSNAVALTPQNGSISH